MQAVVDYLFGASVHRVCHFAGIDTGIKQTVEYFAIIYWVNLAFLLENLCRIPTLELANEHELLVRHGLKIASRLNQMENVGFYLSIIRLTTEEKNLSW